MRRSSAVHAPFMRRSRIVTGLTAPALAGRCAAVRFSGTIGATHAAAQLVRLVCLARRPARHARVPRSSRAAERHHPVHFRPSPSRHLMKPATGRKRPPRLVARFVAISWRDLAVSFGPLLLIAAAAIWVAIRVIHPAPPNTLTISAGPEDSRFWLAAQQYKEILARNGVTLNVLTSSGSLENLKRLADPASRCRSRLRAGRPHGIPSVVRPTRTRGLMSLGSVSILCRSSSSIAARAHAALRIQGQAPRHRRRGQRHAPTGAGAAQGQRHRAGRRDQTAAALGRRRRQALLAGKVDAAFLTAIRRNPR